MTNRLVFKLLCDFVVVAEDDDGYEIASCSVSIMTEKELLKSIGTYFLTHDIHKFSSLDLLYEIGADHLCAFFDADFFCEED